MKMFVKIAIVCAIYLPYRLAFSHDNGFWVDFIVIFIAFALGTAAASLVGPKDQLPNDDSGTTNEK